MWLCTKYGFYSIVQKQPGEFHIRARVKRDLENLKTVSEIKRRIIVTEDADYRYRMVVNEIEVMAAMTILTHTLNYLRFTLPQHGVVFVTLECLYGFATAIPAGIQRICHL